MCMTSEECSALEEQLLVEKAGWRPRVDRFTRCARSLAEIASSNSPISLIFWRHCPASNTRQRIEQDLLCLALSTVTLGALNYLLESQPERFSLSCCGLLTSRVRLSLDGIFQILHWTRLAMFIKSVMVLLSIPIVTHTRISREMPNPLPKAASHFWVTWRSTSTSTSIAQSHRWGR